MKIENSRKTILYVEQNQDGTVGGSYHSLLLMVKALEKTRYRTIVAFYDPLPIVNKFKKVGIETIIFKKPLGKSFDPLCPLLSVPYKFFGKIYNFLVSDIIPFFRCIQFLTQHEVDLVHLNNSAHTGWQWLLACKVLKRKCITHQRGFVSFDNMAKWQAKKFDVIICISHAIEKSLHEKGIFNTTVLYNCIDVDEFGSNVTKSPAEIKCEFGLDCSTFLIGLVANFQEWKGHITVVNAIAEIKEKYPNVVCLLVGDISKVKEDQMYFYSVKREIESRGLNKNVIITGFREDIANIINALDILVHSSIRPEPFGRVIIEAMSLGKPVIATNIGGPSEIIENEISGVLVPPQDVITLSCKIIELMNDHFMREQIGQRAKKRVIKEFNIWKYSEKVTSIYNSLYQGT
ncbi:MAG: glycosyltransferase family 4 protein [Candidatus Heimdallarchaeaceae archaeon]